MDKLTKKFVEQMTTARMPGKCGRCGEPSGNRVLCYHCLDVLGSVIMDDPSIKGKDEV